MKSKQRSKSLLRELIGEFSYLKRQVERIEETNLTKQNEKISKSKFAIINRNRSEKMRHHWRYIKSMKENYFPDKKLKEIRALYVQHRDNLARGADEDIRWRNPSP